MDTVKLIVSNEKFWALIFLLVSQLKDYFLPTFPDPIWTTIIAIISLVVTIAFVKEVKGERAAVKLASQVHKEGEGT